MTESDGPRDPVDPVERNRATQARGTPPGRAPTGAAALRRAVALTAAVVVVVSIVLAVVLTRAA